jgi:signal transduction histidine kinase
VVGEANKIQNLMEEIIAHTHNLAHQFGSLDSKGDDLSTVLKGLAANVKRMFQIPCALNLRGTLPELPPNTATQLYKIAQEAVSNAIKHGKASQVTIGLTRHEDQLVLTVKNDGLPFSLPAGAKNRMGLRIMNYRANTIGAALEVKSAEKSGTIVTCALPIRNGAKPSPRPPEEGRKEHRAILPPAAESMPAEAGSFRR